MAEFGTKAKPKLTEKEYRALDFYSASDLREFNANRRKFFKENIAVDRVFEEEDDEKYSKAVSIGNLVHCYLLEPENFDHLFIETSIKSAPTGLMLKFVESLVTERIKNTDPDTKELTTEFSEIVAIAHKNSGYKLAIPAVLKNFEKINEDGDSPELYFKERLEAKAYGKQLCTIDDQAIARKIVEMVRNDDNVGYLFSNPEKAEEGNVDLFYETKIQGFTIDGLPMKCMMDIIYADHDAKTVQMIDPKVVYDNQNFKNLYYLKRRAGIQGFVYFKALEGRIVDLGFDYKDYTILPPKFIAIDSGCFYRPLIYQMNYDSLQREYDGFTENGKFYLGIKEIIEDIKFAQEYNIWNITKENYLANGVVHI